MAKRRVKRRVSRKQEHKSVSPLRREIGGVLLLALVVLGAIALAHPAGVLERLLAGALHGLWGSAAWLVLGAFAVYGLELLRQMSDGAGRPGLWLVGAVLYLPVLWSWIAKPAAGGFVGRELDRLLISLLGRTGSFVLLIALLLVGLMTLSNGGWRDALASVPRGLGRLIHAIGCWLEGFLFVEVEEPAAGVAAPARKPPKEKHRVLSAREPEPEALPDLAPGRAADTPILEVPEPSPTRTPRLLVVPPAPTDGQYVLPPVSLLQRSEHQALRARDAADRARLLEETLQSFGVTIRVLETVQGPAVTRFEVQPAPGVKVSRIVGLADDIALAMAATDVRIEAPIPGKAAVGIEIPNPEVTAVLLRDVIESTSFQEAPSILTVALGKDIAGRPIMAALDRMPHLLIAGATGAGKSVCLACIICSLLLRARPDQVKFLMVDPKVVELKHYNGIPHLLAPVVTDAKKAAGVLRGVLREMELRYERFAQAGVRDITRFNEAQEHDETRMPYIVVVIDELADLMMVAPVDVEDAICRLAQMARAAGIHLVVATQRPSVDVITGLIKANIPSRIAFAVSSQVDSRTILDGSGAEKLLGKGDMLFAPLGLAKPLRAQGAYIDEAEVEALLQFIRAQGEPQFREDLIPEETDEDDQLDPEWDQLLPDAVRVVVDAHQASASLLQRRMRVGYSRAARMIDQMEQQGLVGPADGAKPREVRPAAVEFLHRFGHTQEEPGS